MRCSQEGGGELQEGAGALAGGMQAGCRAGGVEVAQRRARAGAGGGGSAGERVAEDGVRRAVFWFTRG